jgi:adenosyl cobinamide kinase/adenosyl cobinamide phosphate guanylyltransferase
MEVKNIMKIIFNERKDFKELQEQIAALEKAQLLLLGEEVGMKIVFAEAVPNDFGTQLFLPYKIYSYCGELIKSATLNIAR